MKDEADAPVALVVGATGQDGYYLVRQLKDAGYQVVGTSRRMVTGDIDGVRHVVCEVADTAQVRDLVRALRPREIYNLAGETSVSRSISDPTSSLQSITIGTLNLLEAVRGEAPDSRVFIAGSGEVFGETPKSGATEETPFQPRNPYGIAKAAAASLVRFYREAYGLFICTGFLFNHESPLRPLDFVTNKIVVGALDVAEGRAEKLRLGRLDIYRDWGWAPEYVAAFSLMLRKDRPGDYVIATGDANPLERFVEIAFAKFGLNWREHVVSDPAFYRATDTSYNCGNPAKAGRELGWTATRKLEAVIDGLVAAARGKR